LRRCSEAAGGGEAGRDSSAIITMAGSALVVLDLAAPEVLDMADQVVSDLVEDLVASDLEEDSVAVEVLVEAVVDLVVVVVDLAAAADLEKVWSDSMLTWIPFSLRSAWRS
jgi:hypothetical protein